MLSPLQYFPLVKIYHHGNMDQTQYITSIPGLLLLKQVCLLKKKVLSDSHTHSLSPSTYSYTHKCICSNFSTKMSKRQPRESEIQEPSFQIRPSFEKKFRPGAVKDLIHTVLNDSLTGNHNHFLSISNSYVLSTS